MSIKQNIVYSLNQSRKMLDGLIDTMSSREDWLHQVHPKANHPLWVVGHLGLADNMFVKRLDADAGDDKDWDEVFWFGSEIYSDSEKYPETDEVLSYCHERRAKLMAAVDAATDDFLLSPTPDEGMFADAPNMAQMLLFIAYHEGIHTGQFTIAHRALGNEPMFKPNPQAASN